ncbi:MAG: hypothetical protein M1832_002680 [Thelocarpon impressellum]|nr:MAG: hypothetical protein M1832_002680 [Thelocarpon impressellum]
MIENVAPARPQDLPGKPMPQANHGTPQGPRSAPDPTVLSIVMDESPGSSTNSLVFSQASVDSESVATPNTDAAMEENVGPLEVLKSDENTPIRSRRRASTLLLTQGEEIRDLIKEQETGTKLLERVCCGGGCCFLESLWTDRAPRFLRPITVPDNDAYRSLKLNLGPLTLASELTNTVPVSPQTVAFAPLPSAEVKPPSEVEHRPPHFLTPHPPYEVYPARLHHARELTNPGAEKRTYHFDLDVTDYPEEGGNVDFVVGGAVGVCAPNSRETVDDVFDMLCVPRHVRDKQVLLKTESGRWPTIWGDEKPRELVTTRRELLTWCTDLQSSPPIKPLLSVLAEHASNESEKKILTFLVSAQGQSAFCDLRTDSHITMSQLLHAFPSAKPPLPLLLSNLQQLMPRFYSLSNDPHTSCLREGTNCRRLIEIAVSVHERQDWNGRSIQGLGSGFFERCAKKVMSAERADEDPRALDIRIPMFRGLMANPLAREFVTDGPLLLIGAGVGVAPFRGFVQRRLRSANCSNKVWVLQGVRDSHLDALYAGEWGAHEGEVKKVVQSRRGEGLYVQEEVRRQAELVWRIINALDGRVFVCGSSKGMGEGVETALVDVAMDRGRLNKEDAKAFWTAKKESGQYIAETW